MQKVAGLISSTNLSSLPEPLQLPYMLAQPYFAVGQQLEQFTLKKQMIHPRSRMKVAACLIEEKNYLLKCY
jgi:hypothetical protein